MKRGLEEGGAPYKPLPPERLYLTSGEWEQRLEKRPTGQLYPFDAPGGPNITVVDLGGRPGRDFAPERAQAAQAAEHREASKVGVYDALGGHLAKQAQAGRREIGRASCRERVGRYGDISGVAVRLKKKTWKRI